MYKHERLYYTIEKASEILECDHEYLIHLASEGFVEFCVKIGKMIRSSEGLTGDYDFNRSKLYEVIANKREQENNKIKINYFSDPLTYAGFEILYDVDSNGTMINEYEVSLTSIKGIVAVSKRFIFENEMGLIAGKSADSQRFGVPKKPNFSSKYDFVFADAEENAGGLIGDIVLPEPMAIDKSMLVITSMELKRLKEKGFPEMDKEFDLSYPSSNSDSDNISRKTLANVVKLSRALVSMIPALKNLDVDSITSTKLKEILEAEAAQQQVDFPEFHHQTVAKYFGIESKK